MSGHSHWAGIKRKKALVDKKRGKVFGRLAKGIMVAARHGGGDPAANLSLRYAIDEARAANMPRDTIERAVLKGTGDLEGAAVHEIAYEVYAPGGAAILVLTVTDNTNRTSAEIRQILEKHGGKVGAPGSVAWNFEKRAVFTVASADVPEERLLEIALLAGADDVENEGESFSVVAPPDAFGRVAKALEGAGIVPASAEITFVPKSRVMLEPDAARRVVKLIDAIEDNDDVQSAHTNADLPAEVVAELES